LGAIQDIFAEGAQVRDCDQNDCTDPSSGWVPVTEHYEYVFDTHIFIAASHSELRDKGFKTFDGTVHRYYTSASFMEYKKSDGTSGTYDNPPGSDHWTFVKDAQGCWVIFAFEFNAAHVPFP
jgi:hypothetical protein